MIYGLRKKFILTSAISIVIVCVIIFLVTVVVSVMQLNETMDTLTDAIAQNDGVFPEFDENVRPVPSEGFSHTTVITEETQYSIRFFTVWLGTDNRIITANVESVFSISEMQAQGYTEAALDSGKTRGWVENYRFQVFETENQTGIVFVNGEMNRMMSERFILAFLLVLICSGVVILCLIILLSGRVVQPVAESYEKQKQFITDANHELKTPLTLILSNLDIVEEEIGKNEWLDDIRSEGERMGLLINELVMLSRMDEDQPNFTLEPFDLSGAVSDLVSEFEALAAERQKNLTAEVQTGIVYKGDETMIRRLVAVLLDNAVKYCDQGGQIQVRLYEKHHPVLIVENTCVDVANMELDRLFDRFYRADKARTFDGSFGVGLSIARAVARKHHGDIWAYQKENRIGFKTELK